MARILVLDDDPCLRRLLTAVLKSRGYTVLEGENGRQGLDALRHHPALVVLNLAMPVMDGETFYERARADGYDGPILVLRCPRRRQDRPPAWWPVHAEAFRSGRAAGRHRRATQPPAHLRSCGPGVQLQRAALAPALVAARPRGAASPEGAHTLSVPKSDVAAPGNGLSVGSCWQAVVYPANMGA